MPNPVLAVLLTPSRSYSGTRHTLWGLLVLYAIAVIWGVRSSYYWEESPLELLVGLVINICLAWWAIVDARRCQRPIPMLSQSWFLVFAPFVVPAYIIWSRGWRGLAFLLLHIGFLYALCMVTMILTGIGIFGFDWLDWFLGAT